MNDGFRQWAGALHRGGEKPLERCQELGGRKETEINIDIKCHWAVMAHVFNSRTREAEAVESLRVWAQPGLQQCLLRSFTLETKIVPTVLACVPSGCVLQVLSKVHAEASEPHTAVGGMSLEAIGSLPRMLLSV